MSQRLIEFFSREVRLFFTSIGAFLSVLIFWPVYILLVPLAIMASFLFYHRYEKAHADEVRENVGGLKTQLTAWRNRGVRDLWVYLISLSPLFYFGLLALINYLISTHRI
jgi:hypothetical protein